MKKAIVLFALVAAAQFALASYGGAELNVGTFNIRCQNKTDKGVLSWGSRKADVVNLIRKMKCDVIGERLKTVCEGAPVVLVGDHNCSDGNAASVYLRGIYTDAIYATKTPPRGPWRTYTGWVKIDKELSAASALKMKPSEREKANACRIDYIYVSPKVIDVLAYTTVSVTRKGVGAYCSDHFPSVSRIRLR